MATGAHDRRIRLNRTADWSLAPEHNTQPGLPEKDWGTTEGRLNVEDLDFSHDGRYLAAACEDGMVRVYRITGNQTPVAAIPAGLSRGRSGNRVHGLGLAMRCGRAPLPVSFGVDGARLTGSPGRTPRVMIVDIRTHSR